MSNLRVWRWTILIGVFFFVHSLCAGKLVISKNDGSVSVTLYPNGDMNVSKTVKQHVGAIIPVSGMLVIRDSTSGKFGMSGDSILVSGMVQERNTSALSAGHLSIHTQNVVPGVVGQAYIGANGTPVDGDLMISGTMNIGQAPLRSVAYMDNEGVFVQQQEGESPHFAYATIQTPLGMEGRVDYENNQPQAHLYYITDHLGSTRMVIDDQGNAMEDVVYTAYGQMQNLAISSTAPVREKFTGKEMDTEGKVGVICANMVVDELPTDPGLRGEFIINYDDNTQEVIHMNVVGGGICIPSRPVALVTQTKGLSSFQIKAYLNQQEILNYSESLYLSIGVGDSIVVDLYESANTLDTAQPGNNFFNVNYVEGAYCGLNLYYFGARFYDPEVGMWSSVDPKGQLFNPYAYSSNPVNTIDPNGELFVEILAQIGLWYFGNVMANIGYTDEHGGNPFNPGDWNWNDPMLWANTGMTAFGIGTGIYNDYQTYKANQYFKPQIRSEYRSPLNHYREYNKLVDAGLGDYEGSKLYRNLTTAKFEGSINYYQTRLGLKPYLEGQFTFLGQSYSAVSGPWGNGPSPAGSYIAHNLTTKGLKPSFYDPKGLGWKIYLDPQFNTSRYALRIHPDGGVFGSEGCIGIQGTTKGLYDNFKLYYKYFGDLNVDVIYH